MLNVLQFSLWYLSNGWADWAEIFRDFSLVHKEAFLEISAQSVQLIRRYRSENCNKLSMDISERGLLSSHRKIWWIWITVTRAVDLLDQMTACYRVKYRTRKCYWPIFAWSLNVKAVQAWRLWNRVMKRNDTMLTFLRSLVVEMIQKHGHPLRKSWTLFCNLLLFWSKFFEAGPGGEGGILYITGQNE